MDAVLARIREQGPAKASDFEATQRVKTGWWGWKDEKRWLEALFARGELMVARRDRFQRVYDLSERVMARMGAETTLKKVDETEVPQALLLNAVKALGISQARWIADYYRTKPRHKDADLDGLVASGELVRVNVRGWQNPGYVHNQHAGSLQWAIAGKLRATHTTLLSPFDPVVWDRKRASAMFGRLDAKAHRAAGQFEVKSIHLEAGIQPGERLIKAIALAIQACADWHETPEVRVMRSDPRAFAAALRRALRPGQGAD